MAFISVIIPCYNVGQYLDRTLLSIVRQTIGWTNLEIICIDDASTDNTWEKLQQWERDYPELITIVHCDVNGRQGTARNIGLQYATTEYIAFIDADDWVEPDYFEKLYHPFTIADYDMVTCVYERDFSKTMTFFENRRTEKESRSMTIDTIEKRKAFFCLGSCGYSAVGRLIKKSLLLDNDIYFPENIAYEDVHFGALIHFYVSKLYILEEKLYHYYVNDNSTVLSKAATYHTDWLTIHLIKWRTWNERGLLQEYYEELEYEFLLSGYLGFIKILALRYEEAPYPLFLLLKEMVLAFVPDYMKNKYIREGFTEFQKLVLQALKLPIDKKQFSEIVELVRKHGI